MEARVVAVGKGKVIEDGFFLVARLLNLGEAGEPRGAGQQIVDRRGALGVHQLVAGLRPIGDGDLGALELGDVLFDGVGRLEQALFDGDHGGDAEDRLGG